MAKPEETVRFGYSSPSNAMFNGEMETGIPLSEWDKMTPAERYRVVEEELFQLINIYPINHEGEWS
jgi:hypothetical protein